VPQPENSVDAETRLSSLGRMNHATGVISIDVLVASGQKSASQGRASVATRISPISGPSGYELVPLRENLGFTLYRGRQQGNPSPILAVALAAEQPSPHSIRRLEHEYSLAAELDPAWAAKPLALTRHEGRTILLLNDPCR